MADQSAFNLCMITSVHMGLVIRKPVSWEKQRGRPTCASPQSDQHPCFSLFDEYDIYTCMGESFQDDS